MINLLESLLKSVDFHPRYCCAPPSLMSLETGHADMHNITPIHPTTLNAVLPPTVTISNSCPLGSSGVVLVASSNSFLQQRRVDDAQ